MENSELLKLIDPHLEFLTDTWEEGCDELGTDDLTIIFNMTTESAVLIPRVDVLNQELPPSIHERLTEHAGKACQKNGYRSSFWILFNALNGIACVRVSIKCDPACLPN